MIKGSENVLLLCFGVFFGRNLQTHLEVEAFITVEDEHKATQLMSKGLHWLSLAGTSRTYDWKIISRDEIMTSKIKDFLKKCKKCKTIKKKEKK